MEGCIAPPISRLRRHAGRGVRGLSLLLLAACDAPSAPREQPEENSPAPGAPRAIVALSATDFAALADAEVSEPVRVAVFDSAGRPVPGVAVHFTGRVGDAVLAYGSAVTDADGIATRAPRLGPDLGLVSVEARVDSVLAVPFSVTALPADGPLTTTSGCPIGDALRPKD